MKTNSKIVIIATVFTVFANTLVQMIVPSGPIKFLMLTAAVLVLFGARRIVKALDDPSASGWIRKITIAWVGFEVVFGPTLLMILIGLGVFFVYHGKAKTTKSTDQATDQAE